MNKMSEIVRYTNVHGKTIAIATIAGVLGTVCGCIGYKTYISKNYGRLIRGINELGKNVDGEYFYREFCDFLDNATKSIYPAIPGPGADIRLVDAVSEELLAFLMKHDYSPDDKISSILIGFKK